MNKIQIGAVVVLLAVGAAALLWQQRTNARLREEIAGLPALRAENARLRVENQKLASAADLRARVPATPAPAAATGAPGDKAEAGRPALAAGLVPIESLAGAGRATPRAAFATQLWAARTGDVALEASALLLAPEGRAKLEALMAKLPADVRAQYEPPEKLMALALAASPRPVGGMQVLGETPAGPDDVTLQTAWQHADDTYVHHSNVQMHHDADGWRMVVPEVLVDVAAGFLVRRTGG
ncbi:MAG TPA: hypothetical protein VMD31_12670 [Opitutaceae bacterium]|nr:hypothetical protein [Opitutaceae bacterium]